MKAKQKAVRSPYAGIASSSIVEAKAYEQSMRKVRAGQHREVVATALLRLEKPKEWVGGKKKLKLNCRFRGVLRLEKRRGRVRQVPRNNPE